MGDPVEYDGLFFKYPRRRYEGCSPGTPLASPLSSSNAKLHLRELGLADDGMPSRTRFALLQENLHLVETPYNSTLRRRFWSRDCTSLRYCLTPLSPVNVAPLKFCKPRPGQFSRNSPRVPEIPLGSGTTSIWASDIVLESQEKTAEAFSPEPTGALSRSLQLWAPESRHPSPDTLPQRSTRCFTATHRCPSMPPASPRQITAERRGEQQDRVAPSLPCSLGKRNHPMLIQPGKEESSLARTS